MPIVKASENRVKTGVHFMLGNYALVEGAISAGCNFFGGYPITPANEISERMSQRLPEVGGKFVQGEDELFSIFACTGASLAGGKVMTATASAGFNYMQEGLGYAYTIEAPLVIADVQRCRGENYASQADVYQMRYGASGDYEAIVVCPSSVQELYDYTIWAFNLAEEYMPFAAPEFGCPDAAPLGEGYKTIYSLNPHDEKGSIDWDPVVFDKLYKRVCGKVRENADKICRTERIMMDDAEYALIAYGSEVRPAVEAAELARECGIKAGVLKLCNVWPVPEKAIAEVAKEVKGIFAVEMNMGKYVNEIVRVAAGRCPVIPVTKNLGLVHTGYEILEEIKKGVK